MLFRLIHLYRYNLFQWVFNIKVNISVDEYLFTSGKHSYDLIISPQGDVLVNNN